MNDLVSILMPVFNGERYLEIAIKSVIEQEYSNFELLIYNDGSTDNTAEILSKYSDKRIKIYTSNINMGIVHALNFLIEKANGSLLARIDADDVWYPDKLGYQVACFENEPELYLVACFARLIDDQGNVFHTKFKQYSRLEEIKKYLPNSNFIIHSSVVMKKSLIEKIGEYSEKYKHTEDYDLWLRLLNSKLPFKILSKIMLDYRVSLYSVNYRFRKTQSRNVIRLKIDYWMKNGVKIFYLTEFLRNIYYLFFPYWLLNLKRKILIRINFKKYP